MTDEKERERERLSDVATYISKGEASRKTEQSLVRSSPAEKFRYLVF